MVWAELYASSAARTITNEQGVARLDVSGPGPFGVMASTDATHVEGYLGRITLGESVTLELPARRAPFFVTVRTERGTPVEQARVRLMGGSEAGCGFTVEGTTEKNGTCALTLPARVTWTCSLFADHPDFGSVIAYPEELGEGITLYLEPGGTVSIRVVDDTMQPLAARISYCLHKDGRIMRRARTEDLRSALHVAAVPRWATLCVWAVSPDGRIGIEAVEAPQEIVLVLGATAEVACRIESPVTLHGDGGIWLVPSEACGAWEAIAEWGGADLRDHFLIPLSAQSSSEVMALPTGLRPTRTVSV